jgi:hypothetical protein
MPSHTKRRQANPACDVYLIEKQPNPTHPEQTALAISDPERKLFATLFGKLINDIMAEPE